MVGEIRFLTFSLFFFGFAAYGADFDFGWKFEPRPLTSPACRAFDDYSFRARGNPQLKNGVETDAVVVVKDGVVVYEKYAAPFTRETPHVLWSASKTITYAMVGAAIEKGLVRADDPLSNYYPTNLRLAENNSPFEKEYETVTLQDLVNNGGGFRWNESYEAGLTDSSVIQMLYLLPGFLDTALFAARAPMTAREPDGKWKWVYSSGKSNLLQGVLRKALQKKFGASGAATYDRLPWDYLFTPLATHPRTAFEQDAAGVYVGSSSAHLTPLDMAKFGKLNLDGGKWRGTPLISSRWAAAAHEITDEYLEPGTVIRDTTIEGVAGPSGWWQNKPAKGLPRPYPDAPADLYAAMGHYGQYIVVIPADPRPRAAGGHGGMVMVRTAQDHDPHAVDFNRWVNLGVACFTGRPPAPQFVKREKKPTLRNFLGDRARLMQYVARATEYLDSLRGEGANLDALDENLKGYLEIARFVVEKALLNKMYAGELCTCRAVTRLSEGRCRERVMYPFSDRLISASFEKDRVEVRGELPAEIARALTKTFPDLDLRDFLKKHTAVVSDRGAVYGCHLVD